MFLSQKKVIFFVLVIVSLIIVSFFFLGTDFLVNITKSKNSDTEITFEDAFDAEARDRMTPYQKELAALSLQKSEQEEHSINKINAAFKRGDLNEEEAVKLRLIALTESDKLPTKYQADPPKGRSTLNRDIKWILNNWDQFSEKQKEDFRPYILYPDEEGSIFYPQEEEISSLFIPSVQAYDTGWYVREINSPGEAKLRYFLKSSWSEEKSNKIKSKADTVHQAFNDAWPKYDDLLGSEPDEEISIYLTSMEEYGLAFMKEREGIKKCNIYIKEDENDKTLKASLAHELFHCFQYELSEKYEIRNNDNDWLQEATAVWSEDYVYPTSSSEHIYLKNDFFPTLKDEFMLADGSREYGHYMWFFFITDHYVSADENYVAQVLIEGAESDIREVLKENLSDYEDAYRQFAYYNWNSEPFLNYKDTPEFPQIFPMGALTYELWFNKKEKDFPVKLEPGSMQYFGFSFDPSDKGDHHAVFDFSEHGENISITAMIRQDGNLSPYEDWSQVGEKKICITDNNINSIILAIANSDQKNKAEIDFNLKLEPECPNIPHGYISIKEKVESPMGGGFTEMRSEEILEYNEEEDLYEIVERTATCKTFHKTIQPAWHHVPAQEWKSTGSGSLNESYYDQEDKPYRIYMRNGKEKSLKIAPEVKDQGWVSVVTETTGSPSRQENTTCSGAWPANYDLKPDQITENGIKGKEVLDHADFGGIGTLEIEFEYSY